jgi:hypothetical protein
MVHFQSGPPCVLAYWCSSDVKGYVLAGVEIGVLLCVFFYCGWCQGGGRVCAQAFIRARTRKDYLGIGCEPRYVTDTWRARGIQID